MNNFRKILSLFICLMMVMPFSVIAADEIEPEEEITETEPEPLYVVRISGNWNWTNRTTSLKIEIADMNLTGWTDVSASFNSLGAWKTDLTSQFEQSGYAYYTANENGTLYVFITDPDGTVHTESFSINCFDFTAPTLSELTVKNKKLTARAEDSVSGVKGLYVNGSLNSTPRDGYLELDVSSYTDCEKFVVQAVDYAGNTSEEWYAANPNYVKSLDDETKKDDEKVVYIILDDIESQQKKDEEQRFETKPAKYDVSISGNIGWFNETTGIYVTLNDVNGTGWKDIEIRKGDSGNFTEDFTKTFTKASTVPVSVSENTTLYVFITDTNDEVHTFSFEIKCFDYNAPVITHAAVSNETLYVTTADYESGTKTIFVNEVPYSADSNGSLSLPISSFSSQKSFAVYATDNTGNKSAQISVDNTSYVDPDAKKETEQTWTNAWTDTSYTWSQPSYTAPVIEETPAEEEPETEDSSFSLTEIIESVNEDTISAVGGLVGSLIGSVFDNFNTEDVIAVDGEEIDEEITIEEGTGFSTNSNAVARDLLYDKHTNKQFISVDTRNGNTFYLIIDYDKPTDESGEHYETYFLNLVDEYDLVSLLDGQYNLVRAEESEQNDSEIIANAIKEEKKEEPEPEPVCVCSEHCTEGHVNVKCPVCKLDLTKCEIEEEIPEEPPVCICEEHCEEGTVNDDCPVCSSDYSKCEGEVIELTEEETSKGKSNLWLAGITAAVLAAGVIFFIINRAKEPGVKKSKDTYMVDDEAEDNK